MMKRTITSSLNLKLAYDTPNIRLRMRVNGQIKKIVIILVAFLPIAVFMCVTALYAPVYCDSAYYLNIVNQLANAKLYTEIEFGYTPIYIWVLYISKLLFSIGNNYTVWVFVQLLLCIALAALIYSISGLITNDKRIKLLAVWLTLIALLRSDGYHVLLELPSVLSGVGISYYILQKRSFNCRSAYFLFGIIATIPFWIKQYGGGFIVLDLLILFYYIYSDNLKYTHLLFYLLGVCCPFLFCFFAFPDCWHSIFSDYGTNSAADNLYINYSVFRFIPWAVKYFLIRYAPIIVLAFLPFLRWRKKNLTEQILLFFCTLGFLGYFIQFFFNRSNHYFIYILPFSSILTVCIIEDVKQLNNKKISLICAGLLVLTVCTLSNSAFKNTFYRDYYLNYIPNETRNNQIELSGKIASVLSTHNCKDVFCKDINLQFVNYFCNLRTYDCNSKINNSFGPLAYDEDKFSKMIKMADAVITSNNAEEPFLNSLLYDLCHLKEKQIITNNEYAVVVLY